MIDLTETFEQICQLKGWIYDYGRHDFHNLEEADDENDPKCFFFLDPLERDDSRDDRTIFSSNFMFVQNSNIDEVYHTQRNVSSVDGKFEKRIKPKLTILNDELKKELLCDSRLEIQVWRSIEVVNELGGNFDGLAVKFQITRFR